MLIFAYFAHSNFSFGTFRRLKELESMNEAYRCSLAMKMNVASHLVVNTTPQPHSTLNVRRPNVSVKNKENKILCHTPHFLGRADKKGCLSNHPEMSAYNTPGIF